MKNPAAKPPLVEPTKDSGHDPQISVFPSAGDTSDIVGKDPMGKGQEPSGSEFSELVETEVTSMLQHLLT